MNSKLNNTLSNEISALIIDILEHLDQLERISFDHIDITESLERLKHQHITDSKVGKIYTTALDAQNQTYRLITIGLGNLKACSYQDILKIWGHLFQYIKSKHTEDTYLPMNSFISKYGQLPDALAACGIQSGRAMYEFDHYKSGKKAPFKTSLNPISESLVELDFIHRGISIGRSINLARDFGNMPPNILTPQTFAGDTVNHFKNAKARVDVKDYDTPVSEGFGLLQAAGRSNKHRPRLVIVTYNSKDKDKAPIALVGKSITYDSGGYSTRTKNGTAIIKFDMCGATNIVGIIEVASRLQLPVNIVGVLVCVENMIGEVSMKPGDVFIALSGGTIEVMGTDTKGGLVLADAVFYVNQYQSSVTMGFVILTGAAIIVLSDDKAAAFELNSKVILNDISQISSGVDEMVFELPITATECASIKHSDIADLANHTNRQGKVLFAVGLVTHFSGQTPRIHFDIAGPAVASKALHNGPKGPAGFVIPVVIQ